MVYFGILVKNLRSGRHRSVQLISLLSYYKELLEGSAQSHKADGRTKARTQNSSSEIELWAGGSPVVSKHTHAVKDRSSMGYGLTPTGHLFQRYFWGPIGTQVEIKCVVNCLSTLQRFGGPSCHHIIPRILTSTCLGDTVYCSLHISLILGIAQDQVLLPTG